MNDESSDLTDDNDGDDSNEAKLQHYFDLQATTKSESAESTGLVRMTLTLRFKLELELLQLVRTLASYKSYTPSTMMQRASSNQSQTAHASRRKWPQMGPTVDIKQQLNFKCKYKLTEVTDIAYNELRVKLQSSSRSVDSSDDLTESGRIHDEDDEDFDRPKLFEVRAQALKVDDNRVKQSTFDRTKLAHAIVRQPRTTSVRCDRFGWIQADDPLLVHSSGSMQLSEPLVMSVGDRLQLNCSTARALLVDERAGGSWPQENSFEQVCSDSAQVVRSRAFNGGLVQDSVGDAPVRQKVRVAAGTGSKPTAATTHSVAYLILGSGQETPTSQADGQRALGSGQRRQPTPLSGRANEPATTGASGGVGVGGQRWRSSSRLPELHPSASSGPMQWSSAPPLLEWFINNQEVSCMQVQ